MTENREALPRPSILQAWQRLEASMEAVCATKALREAVRSLEVIRGMGGEAGRMADAAILRVQAEFEADVDLDTPEGTGPDA